MTPRLALAVYVCADPGVPVFGNKGSSAHVRAVLTELVRRTDEVHLTTLRAGGKPSPVLASVNVDELMRPTGDVARREATLAALDAAVASRVERAVGRRTPDVLYERYSLWSCASIELAARRRWPSVLEINAPLIDEQQRHRGLVDRRAVESRTIRAIQAATFPFAVTAEVAAWAERLAGRPVAVISNGVDPRRFGANGHRAVAGSDAITIGFVGTYKPWHDLDAIVAAVEHVHRSVELPAVRVLLVGDGPDRARLLAQLTALGLGDLIEAPGAVSPDRIPALLAEMDVAVAPYGLHEKYFSPLKVFEYLAAGVAVVASRIDGVAGLVSGREALVVTPGDRDEFARAVAQLCADPAARRALGRAGREAARNRFGWDRVVDRILDALAREPAA